MDVFKIELLTKTDEDAPRLPTVEELVKALNTYKTAGQGLVVYHNSLYDYKYDTQLTGYKKVDSKMIIGHLVKAQLELGKVFIIFESNDRINLSGKNYVCFYRAIMQTGRNDVNGRLHYVNLFAIDLINLTDEELEQFPENKKLVLLKNYGLS